MQRSGPAVAVLAGLNLDFAQLVQSIINCLNQNAGTSTGSWPEDRLAQGSISEQDTAGETPGDLLAAITPVPTGMLQFGSGMEPAPAAGDGTVQPSKPGELNSYLKPEAYAGKTPAEQPAMNTSGTATTLQAGLHNSSLLNQITMQNNQATGTPALTGMQQSGPGMELVPGAGEGIIQPQKFGELNSHLKPVTYAGKTLTEQPAVNTSMTATNNILHNSNQTNQITMPSNQATGTPVSTGMQQSGRVVDPATGAGGGLMQPLQHGELNSHLKPETHTGKIPAEQGRDMSQLPSLKITPNPANYSNTEGPAGLRVLENTALQQIAQIIKNHVYKDGQGQTHVTIQLQPEHLGEVIIKLTYRDGNLITHFHTATEQAKYMIEQSAGQLRELLANFQLNLQNISVSVGGENNRWGQEWYQHRGSKKQQRVTVAKELDLNDKTVNDPVNDKLFNGNMDNLNYLV